MTETAYSAYGELKVHVANESLVAGAAAASQRFKVTIDFARYYETKLVDPSFHNGSWGGSRNTKFDARDQENFDVSVRVPV